MPSLRRDQADGLRRLLDRDALRVVNISAGAGTGTGTVINLAGALAEIGRDVLILDDRPGEQGVAAALGLAPRFDLEDVIRRKRDLDEVIVRGPAGLRILPIARGARALAQLHAAEQQRLAERCGRLGFPVDTLLIDSAPGGARALLTPGMAAQELIVLAGGGAMAVTAAYALIKRRAGEFGRREFHVLVGEVADEAEARDIFGNIARVARRYLQVSLVFIGHISADDKLQQAARLRLPLAAAFPGAPAAAGFRRLAHAVARWPHAGEEGSGFDDFMRGLIQSSRVRTPAAATSP